MTSNGSTAPMHDMANTMPSPMHKNSCSHRRTRTSTMGPAADWSSLLSDLVRRVADVFLATSDFDYYISLRAVCPDWRAATADPRGPDAPRFRPHRWVMLDKLAGDDPCIVNNTNYSRRLTPDHPLAGNDGRYGRRLFLHADTGRFLWMDLPMLRAYTCLASTADGLLLREAKGHLRIFVLNPFTGHRVRLPVEPNIYNHYGNVVVAGSSPTILLYYFCNSQYGSCIDPAYDPHRQQSNFTAKPTLESFAGTVAFQGRAYAADMKGTVAAVDADSSGHTLQAKLTTVVAGTSETCMSTFLVDNAGHELLLVRAPFQDQLGTVQVFRVDLERKTYLDQPVKCIGNRAIFLGKHRSLSVDADNLPAIEGNCIYYIGGHGSELPGIRIHHLEDGRVEVATTDFFDNVEKRRPGPFSLAEYMLRKCYIPFKMI